MGQKGGVRFHHAAQNSMQFKTYELFMPGIFHLIFLDCGRQVIETAENETMDKGDYYTYICHLHKPALYSKSSLNIVSRFCDFKQSDL